MSLRTTLILVFLVVVVGIVVYINPFEKDEKEAPDAPRLVLVNEERIKRIEVMAQGQTASFVKKGETGISWEFETLPGIPVSHYRWGGIPLLLSGPKSLRGLPLDAAGDLSQYGLDPPAITIKMRLNEDQDDIILFLGHRTPDGTAFYAREEGYSGVLLMDKNWGEVLSRLAVEPPYPSWYPNKEVGTIEGVRLYADGTEVSFELDSLGWYLDDVDATPVDVQEWGALFPLFEGPPSFTIVPDAAEEDSETYGITLESPQIAVKFLIVSSRNVQYRDEMVFKIGNKTTDGQEYYILPWGPSPLAGTEDPSPIIRVEAQWVDTILNLVENPPLEVTQ